MFTRIFFISFLLVACASKPPETGVLAPTCARTPVKESDLEQFGFKPVPGKIVVLRVFATWCPFCKLDLAKIGELYRDGTWSADTTRVFLLSYRTHGETRDTVEAFEREDLKRFGIPKSAVQVAYVDQDVTAVRDQRSRAGTAVFAGLAGLPYGLIFGKDGRLIFRGHFTTSDSEQKKHYEFITLLQRESCGGD